MERTITALAAAWCIAPLVAIGTMYVCYLSFGTSISSDRSIANGLMTGIIAVITTAGSFLATMIVIRQYVPDRLLRVVQIGDAIGTAIWLIVAFVAWQRTWMYPINGTLEVEVRAPKTDVDRMAVHFGEGEAHEIPHRDLVREEGELAILPVEMEVTEHHGWWVAVLRNTNVDRGFWERYRYELPLPQTPAGPTQWSDWLKPVRKSEWDATEEVTLRFRWR